MILASNPFARFKKTKNDFENLKGDIAQILLDHGCAYHDFYSKIMTKCDEYIKEEKDYLPAEVSAWDELNKLLKTCLTSEHLTGEQYKYRFDSLKNILYMYKDELKQIPAKMKMPTNED